jgi:hypothetical protein
VPYRHRGRFRLPFIYINWTRRGFFSLPRYTSHTWHFGPWSKNSRTRKTRVDTPGPGSYEF